MTEQKNGHRKDGQPYKPGNTREDGSYINGKNRTSVHTRFAKGDGRPRGRRAKGTKNLATDFAEELAEKITVNEGGKQRKITKQRALVKKLVERGMKSSDRASEIVLRHASTRDNAPGHLGLTDQDILDAFLAARGPQPGGDPDGGPDAYLSSDLPGRTERDNMPEDGS